MDNFHLVFKLYKRQTDDTKSNHQSIPARFLFLLLFRVEGSAYGLIVDSFCSNQGRGQNKAHGFFVFGICHV
jgi:hypothetical protein